MCYLDMHAILIIGFPNVQPKIKTVHMKCKKVSTFTEVHFETQTTFFSQKACSEYLPLNTKTSSIVTLGSDADCCNSVLLLVLYYIRLIFPATSLHTFCTLSEIHPNIIVSKSRVHPKRCITGVESRHKKTAVKALPTSDRTILLTLTTCCNC